MTQPHHKHLQRSNATANWLERTDRLFELAKTDLRYQLARRCDAVIEALAD